MPVRIFSVCTKIVFNTKEDGKERVKWYRAGTLKMLDSGQVYLKMFHQPQVDFVCFEQKQEQDERELPVIQVDKQ
ncbi:MAG TPA: hypothetical protein VFU15_10250 [Bacteroidia bacterium]|nr:hypothetical protein [Bacteroidia bacterium]